MGDQIQSMVHFCGMLEIVVDLKLKTTSVQTANVKMKLQNVRCTNFIKMDYVTMQTTMKDAIMMVEIVVDAREKLKREHVQDVSVLILITILIVLIRLS